MYNVYEWDNVCLLGQCQGYYKEVNTLGQRDAIVGILLWISMQEYIFKYLESYDL